MAEIVIDVMDLIGPLRQTSEIKDDEDDDMLVEFSSNASQAELSAGFRKLWGMVLCMAVRDRATQVQYHPWRKDPLSYVVDNVRYEMVPPPVEYAAGIVTEARLAFTQRPGFFARLFGRGRVSCGTLSLIVGAPFVWDVVVWTIGERSGVEFFAVTPVEPPKAE